MHRDFWGKLYEKCNGKKETRKIKGEIESGKKVGTSMYMVEISCII